MVRKVLAVAAILLGFTLAIPLWEANAQWGSCYYCYSVFVPDPNGGAPSHYWLCFDFDPTIGYRYCRQGTTNCWAYQPCYYWP